MPLRPRKSGTQVALAHQAATHPTTIKGTEFDVTGKRAARMYLFHGYVEAASDADEGSFLIQIKPEIKGSESDEHWTTLASQLSAGTTPDTEALTATEPAAETSLAVDSTTGFVAGDNVYIQDAGTLADSEWGHLESIVADTSLELLDGLTTAKDDSDVAWNDATIVSVLVDLTGVGGLRVVWAHEGSTGANGHVKALVVFDDGEAQAGT